MAANDAAVADNIAFTLVFRSIVKIKIVPGGDDEFTTAHSIRMNAMAFSGRAVGTALVEYVTFRVQNSLSPPFIGDRSPSWIPTFSRVRSSFIGIAENLCRTPWILECH